jgi:hypothetical protein
MTMYLEHFGLREAPFRITPHTEFFFSGANRGATLEALLYAITAGEGMVKVTGEVGSGKTMLCRVLMERLPQKVETIYLAVPSLSRDEMLAAIATDLGIETTGANTTKLVKLLQDRLIEVHAGRQAGCRADRRGARDAARHARGSAPALQPRDQQGKAAADRAVRPARARRAPGAAQHAPAEGAHHACVRPRRRCRRAT